jgi:hypothetical protein
MRKLGSGLICHFSSLIPHPQTNRVKIIDNGIRPLTMQCDFYIKKIKGEEREKKERTNTNKNCY